MCERGWESQEVTTYLSEGDSQHFSSYMDESLKMLKETGVTLFVGSFENIKSAFTHTALFGNVTEFLHLEVICERDPLSKRWQISSGSSLAADYFCIDAMCEQSCKIKGLSLCKVKSSSQSYISVSHAVINLWHGSLKSWLWNEMLSLDRCWNITVHKSPKTLHRFPKCMFLILLWTIHTCNCFSFFFFNQNFSCDVCLTSPITGFDFFSLQACIQIYLHPVVVTPCSQRLVCQ